MPGFLERAANIRSDNVLVTIVRRSSCMESCMHTENSLLDVKGAQAAPAPRTRAAQLAGQIGDDIIHARLAPGVRLDETELARRFGVSRTPVREAIRQLVASGLVEARAHRGALVARPSAERLEGMFEAMAELESLCAGLAA